MIIFLYEFLYWIGLALTALGLLYLVVAFAFGYEPEEKKEGENE